MNRSLWVKTFSVIDENRKASVQILDGAVGLLAFNTVLSHVDMWYLGFIGVMAVLSLLFVYTAPSEKKHRPRVSYGPIVIDDAPLFNGVVEVDANPLETPSTVGNAICEKARRPVARHLGDR